MLCKTVLSLCVSFVVFLCVLCFLVQCFTLLRFDVLSEGLMEFLDRTPLLCCVFVCVVVFLCCVIFCCVLLCCVVRRANGVFDHTRERLDCVDS